MSVNNFSSRILLVVLSLGLLLGAGVGWVLAEAPRARPEGSGFQFYVRLTGNSFRPVHHATTFVISNSVCLYRSDDSGYASLTYDLQLPDGAEISGLTLYYNDQSLVHNVQLDLRALDGAGNGQTVASVDSSGTGGFGSASSARFSHTVDNFAEALTLQAVLPNGAGSQLKICGVRVGYQYDPAASYLPAVLRQGAP